MIESPDNIPHVIERGLVKVAAPLILDTASSVRNAAAGMLRNLSALKLEICGTLMDQDVMTPLTCYFHEVSMPPKVMVYKLKIVNYSFISLLITYSS